MCRWRALCVELLAATFVQFFLCHACATLLTTAATRRSRSNRVLHSLTPAIWAVMQSDPWQGRRFLEPEADQWGQKRSGPEADPQAKSEPIKIDQQRSKNDLPKPSRPQSYQQRSKKCFFPFPGPIAGPSPATKVQVTGAAALPVLAH